MSYEADIRNAMLADEGLTNLIGTKVFWDVAEGDTPPPYVVLQTVSNSGETAFDGSRDDEFPLIQFVAWAATKLQSIAIRSAIRTAIEGRDLSGTSNTSLGYSNDLSGYDPQTKLFSALIEYRASSTTT